VLALFTYAAAHPEGFRLLFDSTATGEAARIHADLVDTITGRVAEKIRRYLLSHDRKAGRGVELLAAMMVGTVGRAAEHTHRSGIDPLAAGELATRFIMAALTNLDPAVIDIATG
jgi:hypothetical protein